MNFVLRCYLPNLDNRLATINELYMAIDKALREAGITIAFPQRDVHMDPAHPLEVRVRLDKNAEPQTDRPAKSSDIEDH